MTARATGCSVANEAVPVRLVSFMHNMRDRKSKCAFLSCFDANLNIPLFQMPETVIYIL